ncbi:MAG TPA: Sec-independent protein translocase subunit TatA [Jiangellaceae bacterium]
MFRNFGAPEIILILVVLVLLFGAKKLPDLARGVGRSLKIFKAETKGLRDDDTAATDDAPAQPAAAQPVQRAVESPPVVADATPKQPETERRDA